MFKNLKSLFVIEEEGPTDKKKLVGKKGQTSKTGSKSKSTSSAGGPTINQSKVGDPGRVTPKFINVLLKAMEQNNLDGFDYLEYKQSLKSLKKMPMDEQTRYQSAFAMAQTMGATPAALLQTAQHYIDILNKEEQKFEEALTKQRLKKIGSKEQAIKKLEETIKVKAEQIKRLTQEINAHQKERDTLKKTIQESVIKVDSTKNNFIVSFDNLVKQIQGDMENIKKYLK